MSNKSRGEEIKIPEINMALAKLMDKSQVHGALSAEAVKEYYMVQDLISQEREKARREERVDILADIQVITMLINKSDEEKVQDIFDYTKDRLKTGNREGA